MHYFFGFARCTRHWRASVLLFLSAGCREKASTASHTAAVTIVASVNGVAGTSSDGSVAPQALASGELDAGPAAIEVSDSPPWSAGKRLVKLVWAVHSPDPSHHSEDEKPLEVDLILRVDSVERRVSLGALQGGPVLAEHQVGCSHFVAPSAVREAKTLRDRADVAAILFGQLGNSGYAVRRVTKSSVGVFAFSQDDGNCPDAKGGAHACPKESVLLKRVNVPAVATFEEATVSIDADGRERPFDCAARPVAQRAAPTPSPQATPCKRDSDCVGVRCNVPAGWCQFPCGSDADCQSGWKCALGPGGSACIPVL